MKTWFTSDHHFGHKNIIHLCNRPFKSVDEMNQVLIDNWNASIAPDDVVYVLGDFMYKSAKTIDTIAPKLNGHKQLIKGNHDRLPDEEYAKHFVTVRDVVYAQFADIDFVLFHYPILSWLKRSKGSIHLYGHVHNSVIGALTTCKAYNVGVDTNDFKPVELDAILELMKQRKVFLSEAK